MKNNLETFKFRTVGGKNPNNQKYRKSEVDKKINALKQELQELKDSLWLDIRQEENHQLANPEIDPHASNMAIQHTKGRRYQIDRILGEA